MKCELQRLEEEKTKAVMIQDFTTALHLKSQEDKLKKQKIGIPENCQPKTRLAIEITSEDIARTVSTITKIPLNKLVKTEAKKLTNLEKTNADADCRPGRSD